MSLASFPGSCEGRGKKRLVHTVGAYANFAVVYDRKIIQIIIFMTMCWLYGYIISSILRSIYERERDGFPR